MFLTAFFGRKNMFQVSFFAFLCGVFYCFTTKNLKVLHEGTQSEFVKRNLFVNLVLAFVCLCG